MSNHRVKLSQARAATMELALLGFLRERPMHGYEIHQQLADPLGLDGLWQIKLSRLYAMLGRLEAQGYLSARTQPQGDRPPRKLFSLTPAGQSAFFTWVEAPVGQPRALRLEFMLKLYFAQLESPATMARLVASQRRQCAEWLAGPLVIRPSEDAADFRALVSRYRHGQIAAMATWLDSLSQAEGKGLT